MVSARIYERGCRTTNPCIGDWELASYEAYASEADAREREQRLKDYGKVKQLLRKRIMCSLQMV
jgi:hypothetical protein